MRSTTPKMIFLFGMVMPTIAFAHPGGIDARGGHECRTNCTSWGLANNQYHFHPEKMDSDQLEKYEEFKGRLCERVVRRFQDDEKMWKRVNERVSKRFGFECSDS